MLTGWVVRSHFSRPAFFVSYAGTQSRVRTCLHVIRSRVTRSNQGLRAQMMGRFDSLFLSVSHRIMSCRDVTCRSWQSQFGIRRLALKVPASDFITSAECFSFTIFFSACDFIQDVFLCVSNFSRLKSSVCNGIKRDTCRTPIPGQLSVFNAICGLPLLVGFVPYC